MGRTVPQGSAGLLKHSGHAFGGRKMDRPVEIGRGHVKSAPGSAVTIVPDGTWSSRPSHTGRLTVYQIFSQNCTRLNPKDTCLRCAARNLLD